MKNKKDLIIIIIFLAFLFLPSGVYLLIKNKMDNTNYENRVLFEKPIFSLKTIKTYAKDYENYFNDNLAFKNEIRKIRAYGLYYGLGTSANDRVIVGKNGWLFYNSIITEKENNSVKDYQRNNYYTKEEKENIKNILNSDNEYLKKKGIKYYILVGPNKEIVYNDYMPKTIKINEENEYSRTEDLISYLSKEFKNIIYPKKPLNENRSIADTYYKYDTHWNYYGGYIASMELMKLIDNNFKNADITIEKDNTYGDLGTMNITNIINEEPIVNNFYDNVEYTCNEKEIDLLKECSSKNALYNDTLLIIGDSFRNATIPYFAKLYKNVIVIHRTYYETHKDAIDKYKPNIVINVVVERGSNLLGLTLQ